jgi:long-chain acyl-CoA synthetase
MTDMPYPLEKMLQLVREQGHETWLRQPRRDGERTWTWEQAADEIGRMAAALRALELEPGAAIAISGANTAHWLMADFAIALAGLVSVGLYPKQATEHISYILEHSGSKAVLVGPMPDVDEFMSALPDGLKTIGLPYPGVPDCDTTWDAMIADVEPVTEYTPPEPDELMTLVYTSGSTGDPKGVMITYRNVLFAADGLTEALPGGASERLFSYLPLAHVFERVAISIASVYYEAEVYFLGNPATLADELAAYAPTRFYAVPLVWNRIQTGVIKKVGADRLRLMTSIPIVRNLVRARILAGVGLQHTRACVSGSAPLPLPSLEWFHDALGVDVLQGYGLSETTLYATANLPRAQRMGSVGQPLPGAEIVLTEEGEVLIRHGAVMKGYYRDEEKTREAFTEEGFLKTGDRGKIDDDGFLWITGRVKEIFKTLKGKYVAPAPIEGAMRRNGAIDQASLVGAGLNQPIMLITLTPDARELPRDEVQESLLSDMKAVNEKLEPHERIGKLVVLDDEWTIDNGLLTPTMKVKASAVEDRYADLIKAEAAERADISWAGATADSKG